jgi:hypothetical protein
VVSDEKETRMKSSLFVRSSIRHLIKMKEAHMSFKKKILAVAAAGVLSALAAVPAMAFENEFHGSFALKYFVDNYEIGGFGPILPQTFNASATAGTATSGSLANTTQNMKTNNYFEQRARIFYTAKASDDLKLVTGFEIDSVWGDKAQGSVPGNMSGWRNAGGGMESDAVNLETKWVYLDFKVPSTPVNVKAGIQAYKDPFKGVFLDADLAGTNFTAKTGALTSNIAYFRAYDNSFLATSGGFGAGQVARPRGMDNLQFIVLDEKFAVSKDINVGAAYIATLDNRQQNAGFANDFTDLHTFGLYGDAKFGIISLSGFAAGQQGSRVERKANLPANASTNPNINGWAFNGTAKVAIGPGAFKTALLMTTGSNTGDNGWQAVQQRVSTAGVQDQSSLVSAGCNSYNDSGMMLLNRNTAAQGTSTDNSLVYSTNNNNQGLWLYSLGYDATITPKISASVNAGAAWTAKNIGSSVASNGYTRPLDLSNGAGNSVANGSNFLGTEINIQTNYKMYDNLTASLQAAYVLLGGYYKNSALVTAPNSGGTTVARDPENPYTARVMLSYAF